MMLLVLGLLLFVAAHLVPALPALAARAQGRLGVGGRKILVSVLAGLGLVLIVYGYAGARADGALVLYDPPRALRHVALTLLIPVFPLLLAAYLPGKIRATLKHPMLAAVKLWALAHLLANGTLPDVVLFGGLLAWAVFDRISLKRRGVAPPPSGWTAGDALAILGGLGLYGAFVWRLHLWLFGVSPL